MASDEGEPQEAEMAQPWSEDRRSGWEDGYLAGLSDATKITHDALANALEAKFQRIKARITETTAPSEETT